MTTLLPAAKSSEELTEFFKKAFIHTSAMYGVAVGVHVGLFDVMTQFDDPVTSQEIADRGRYKERYVREWLGCMVMAGLVSVDATSRLYLLPHSHRQILNKDNLLAITATLLTITGHSLQQVCACFHQDGPLGIDYNMPHQSIYDDYLEARSNIKYTWNEMKTNIIDMVPGLNQALDRGIQILEIGCGKSTALIMLAEKYINSKFTGIDINTRVLDLAKKEIKHKGLDNVEVLYCDVYQMPQNWISHFDWSFCIQVIHDLPFVVCALQCMKQVMKPDSYISIVDIESHSKLTDNLDKPGHGVLVTFSLFSCLPLSMNSEGSDGMGAAWGVEMAKEKIKEAGLELVGDNTAFGHMHHYLCK